MIILSDYLIGVKEGTTVIMNLALDRIQSIEDSDLWYQENENFNAETYFQNAIGVSVSPNLAPLDVQLYVNYQHAPYVLTKPLHPSQQILEKDHYGVTISLKVQHNFELEKTILGFGEGIKVLAPDRLRRVIKERIETNLDLYNTEITERGLLVAKQKLKHKGFAIFNRLYTGRELKVIHNTLYKNIGKFDLKKEVRIASFLSQYPKLEKIIFNKNLARLIQQIDPNATLVNSILFNHAPLEQTYLNWHQTAVKKGRNFQQSFCIRIHIDDYKEATGRQHLLSGSHNKRFTTEEIALLSNNSNSFTPDLYAGSALIMHPLLIRSFSKTTIPKRHRVIHLVFSSKE